MVGAVGAVDARGAAELGDDRDDGFLATPSPMPLSIAASAPSSAPSSIGEPAVRRAFGGMGIPAVEGERADARAVGAAMNFAAAPAASAK